MMQAFRETLLNAMEDGEAFNPEQVVEVTRLTCRTGPVFDAIQRSTSAQHPSLPSSDTRYKNQLVKDSVPL